MFLIYSCSPGSVFLFGNGSGSATLVAGPLPQYKAMDKRNMNTREKSFFLALLMTYDLVDLKKIFWIDWNLFMVEGGAGKGI